MMTRETTKYLLQAHDFCSGNWVTLGNGYDRIEDAVTMMNKIKGNIRDLSCRIVKRVDLIVAEA